MSHARIQTSAENLRQPQRNVDEFQDSEAKKEEVKDVCEYARVCYYPHCAISNLTLFVSHGGLPPLSRRTVHYALSPENSGSTFKS